MPIKPALTKEEWELVKENGLYGIADAHTLDANYGIHYLDEHAVAALHLQGREFGFTWEDVDRHHARAELTADPTEAAWCRSMAERIEALLPPRDVE